MKISAGTTTTEFHRNKKNQYLKKYNEELQKKLLEQIQQGFIEKYKKISGINHLKRFCHPGLGSDGDALLVLLHHVAPELVDGAPPHPGPLTHGVQGEGQDVVDKHHGLHQADDPVPQHAHHECYTELTVFLISDCLLLSD